jgi:hypothetical protein
MNIGLIIVLGVILIGVILIIIITLIKSGKGKIEIIPEKTSYNFGETITGNINVKLKKPIQSKNLRLRLYAERTSIRITRNNEGRNERNNQKDIIFDFTQDIEKAKEYSPGEYNFPFKINLPKQVLGLNGIINNVNKVFGSLNQNSSYVKGYISANLDAGIIDVNKRIEINVS